MTDPDATPLLKAERYLRFHGLQAGPEFDAVTLWVDGAEVSDREEPAGTGSDEIDRILGPVRAIETGPGCLRYCITFHNCIAYAWRDETFALPERDEDFSTMMREKEASAFLDFVRASTRAEESFDGPLRHFCVATLDAILDVICPEEPAVTAEMLDPDDPGPLPGRPREAE